MDKSDLKKLGIGGLAGVAFAVDIDVDLVEFIQLFDWQVIPVPMVSDGHQAFAEISASASSTASAT